MRLLHWVALAWPILAAPALAQRSDTPPTQAEEALPPRTILFVGNSFTQGAHSALRNWRSDRVNDLNGTGLGGVPALFASFARQRGLRFTVAQETVGGKSLVFHYVERRHVIDRAWNTVVLQEYSTLDRERPGDETNYQAGVGKLVGLFRARNPAVDIHLMATWSRADLIYSTAGRWQGTPIEAMASDLRAAANRASATFGLAGILPVGEAWNLSFAVGVADPNPFDGIARSKVNLWSYDDYHGSLEGYYLEALVVFGAIAGVDPRLLGRDEPSADELGIAPAIAVALQQIAYDQLSAEGNWPRTSQRAAITPRSPAPAVMSWRRESTVRTRPQQPNAGHP